MATCTAQIGLTAASNTSLPISGTVTWKDGAGTHSQPVNMPYPGTPTEVTLTDVTSVSMTASSSGFTSQTLPVTCGQYTQFELGGGPSGSSCFIATAAYETASAPELQMLRGLRDGVLTRTQWGRDFFERFYAHYFRISPQIAGQMNADPELRTTVRWAIVEPWIKYMKLVIGRPDIHAMSLDGLDPALRSFLQQIRTEVDAWIDCIELPKTFNGRDPVEAVDELNIVLGLLLLRTRGRAYLDDLEARGELPLHYPKADEERLHSALAGAGRSEDEIASILYGAGDG
jgi:hypothetical protein